MLKTVFRCMQLRSVPMGVATVIMGCAVPQLSGNIYWPTIVLFILFAIAIQITANLFHYYCDEKYHYGESIDLGYVGSSVGGLTLERMLREASITFSIISLSIGLTILAIEPIFCLLMGILLAAVIYFNNAGPYPFCRHPWDIVIAFLFFGPIGVVATSYIQIVQPETVYGEIPLWEIIRPGLLSGLSMGLFAVISVLFFSYRNYERDIENDVHTIATRFGLKATRTIFLICALIIYALSIFFCFRFHFSNAWPALIVPTFCTAYNLYLWARLAKDWKPQTSHWENFINWNMLIFAVSAFIEFYYFGIPDDNAFTYF